MVNILREITPGSDRIGADRITDRITDRIMDRITNQKQIEKYKKLNRLKIILIHKNRIKKTKICSLKLEMLCDKPK